MSTLKYKKVASENDMAVRLNQWMQAVRAPTPYRVAGRTLNLSTVAYAKIGIFLLLLLSFFLLFLPIISPRPGLYNARLSAYSSYNSTYPLTTPVKRKSWTRFRIGAIADLDTDSKQSGKEDKWISYFKTGVLSVTNDLQNVSIEWNNNDKILSTKLSEKGRSLELSDLVVFNGKLYSCDDRTGIIYEILSDGSILPWVILLDGNGRVQKGRKILFIQL